MNVLLERPAGIAEFDTPVNVPVTPPASWFTEIPDWFDLNKGLIQVALNGPEEGRVAALVAPWGECILDGKEGCWTPPPTQTGYEFAHVGTTVCDDGSFVRTANVGGRVDHADIMLPMKAAVDHYANTAVRMMRGRYVDTPNGIMFLGSMWPGSTRFDALTAIASALSGDWRYVESLGAFEMAGSQLVNNPGFRPVPRRAALFAVTAAMGSNNGAVIGRWDSIDPPAPKGSGELSPDAFREVAAKIASLTSVLMPLAAEHPDVALISPEGWPNPFAPPTAASHDDMDDMDEAEYDPDSDGDDDATIQGLFDDIFGCPHCHAVGCRKCRHTGYQLPSDDDEVGYDVADLDDAPDPELLASLDGDDEVEDVPLIEI